MSDLRQQMRVNDARRVGANVNDTPMRDCKDCGLQPVWEFYASGAYCKACTKRRSTESQKARRAANAAKGLPVITSTTPRKVDTGYLDRLAARRAVEATRLSGTQRTSPVEEMVLCSIETEHSYSSLAGLIDDLLRRPSGKVRTWKAA